MFVSLEKKNQTLNGCLCKQQLLFMYHFVQFSFSILSSFFFPVGGQWIGSDHWLAKCRDLHWQLVWQGQV